MTTALQIRECLDPRGRSHFRQWFDGLSPEASRKVVVALYRVGLGNFSNTKGVGQGVYECRVNFGPGYRVYFGKDGEHLVVLLGGGSKKNQQRDIRLAIERWDEYKRSKEER